MNAQTTTKYYMTTMHHGAIGSWIACKASTLDAAKREATKELGGGYLDHTLCIGEVAATDEHGNPDIQTVASRIIRDSRWS